MNVEELAQEIAAEVVDNGDTWCFEGTSHALRLKIESDQDYNLDYADDCYGTLAPVERSRWEERERPRPDGFNGRARKITGNVQGDYYWWQPPAGVDHEHLLTLLELVRAIVAEGFYSIGVELLSGDDAYHQPIVIAAEWLGGVEPAIGAEGASYYREIVREQIVELLMNCAEDVRDEILKAASATASEQVDA